LSLEGFQYKNNLIIEQSNKKLEVENTYWNRYQDVLNQINTENALAEEVRQYNETLAEEKRQFDTKLDFDAEQARLDREHDEALVKLEHNFKAKQAELDRQHDKDMLNAKTEAEKELIEEKYQADKKLLADKLANDKKLLAEELKNEKSLLKYQKSLSGGSGSINKGGGSGGSSGKGSGGGSGSSSSIIANRNGNGWIEIPGHGRFSKVEVNEYLKDGTIKATVSNGKVKYTWVGKQAKNVTPDAKGYAAKQKDLFFGSSGKF
jgi:membrane protein involved in colicin uptake